ncbi:MAG TPA: bifunctional 4-hydroxy-3-methylbut-2-enyl diphosphate reductase/30S ribosomal protein S1 [Terriglobales bacterium]|nr:bifunctional 4-hydroxy-3-methylbut-2-enyl diphosphate reductase/30S ribosomal protein S1 [Terriglobales bacterium]
MSHEVIVAKTAGFCFGVRRAVEGVYKLLDEGRTDIVTIGPLIHNPQIVRELEARGVKAVDSVPAGVFAVIRSHGIPREAVEGLEADGTPYADLTCPYVGKIHKLVAQASQAGDAVFVFGHKEHPEVAGIVSYANNCMVFRGLDELATYTEEHPEATEKSTLFVAQTTFELAEWEKCLDFAKKHYTKTKIFDTICCATESRQKEAADLAATCDLMLVIGGRNSSNTNRLYEICKRICEKTLLVESPDDIPDGLVRPGYKVGITAGASTPASVIKEAATKMSEMNETTERSELNPEEAVLTEKPVQAAAETANEEDKPEETGELSFEQMLEDSLLTLNTGDRVKVTITSIGATEVQVDLGTKQSAYIPIGELSDDPSLKPEDVVKPGDEIEVFVVRVNDVEGTIMLSKKRVDAIRGWDEIEAAVDNGAVMEGTVAEVVKGGIIAVCKGVRIFIPGSQVPGGRDADHAELVGTTQKFRILEVNRKRRRVIGSIRAVSREARRIAEEAFWSAAEVGKKYKGVVKSLTSYGAFVDVGGVDGMIHLSELSWNRIRHPSEAVSVGDSIEVYIKDLDAERKRISLGYKNLLPNPWDTLKETYKEGDTAHVKIVKLMPFGAFAELVPGIDGLIYISQISTKRIDKPASVLSVGDEVDVKIVSIDYEAMRVNLSIRALLEGDQNADTAYQSARQPEEAPKAEAEQPEVEAQPEAADGQPEAEGAKQE